MDGLGAPLFERERHGRNDAHRAGKDVACRARILLQQAETFYLRAQRAAEGHLRRLAIGFGLSSIALATKWVARFRTRFPELELVLDDMSSAEQVARLLSGELQLGFIRLPVPEALSACILQTDRLALVTPGEPVGPVCFDDIAGEALIALLPQRGQGLAWQIRQLYEHNGAQPKILQYASDVQTVLSLVAAGVGRAIVLLSAANIAPATVGLTPLDGEPAACE